MPYTFAVWASRRASRIRSACGRTDLPACSSTLPRCGYDPQPCAHHYIQGRDKRIAGVGQSPERPRPHRQVLVGSVCQENPAEVANEEAILRKEGIRQVSGYISWRAVFLLQRTMLNSDFQTRDQQLSSSRSKCPCFHRREDQPGAETCPDLLALLPLSPLGFLVSIASVTPSLCTYTHLGIGRE